MYQYIFQFRKIYAVITYINLTIKHINHINHYQHGATKFVTSTNSQPSLSRSVCSYHIKYAFQSESTPYSCMNVKESFLIEAVFQMI